MTWEENWEFCQNRHGMVKPLSENYVCVGLGYYQIKTDSPTHGAPGPFYRKHNIGGADTAGQFVISPDLKLIGGEGRCWKGGKGITADELNRWAGQHPADSKKKNTLRLSWFMMDPAYYRKDVVDDGPYGNITSATGMMEEARQRRRPICRVDGAALTVLENHQEFLSRHVRQYWWEKGDPNGPARLVVLNPHDIRKDAPPNELTGKVRSDRVPTVMGVIDLSGGLSLEKVSPGLDECWRQYMAKRPDNYWHHYKSQPSYPIAWYQSYDNVDATIRKLAESGQLLAPGGRPLFSAKNGNGKKDGSRIGASPFSSRTIETKPKEEK